MRLRNRSFTKAIAAVLTAGMALSLSSCFRQTEPVVTPAVFSLEDDQISLSQAETENHNRLVQEQFRDEVHVLPDPWGLESVELFFGPAGSNSIVISENTDSAKLRAASIAVAQRAPMVTYDDSIRSELIAQMDHLGTTRILLVGKVPFAATSGEIEILHDPGTTGALGEMTAFQFTSQVVGAPENMAQAVADLDPKEYTELKAAWEPLYREERWETQPIPAQSRRDSGMSPVIIGTPESSVASIANANAWGGDVWIMPTGDPRDSKQQMALVSGLENGPLVALSPQFGDTNLLTDRIRQGWNSPTSAESMS